MPSKIKCRVTKAHGPYNAGEKVGLTFRDYEREMRKPEKARRFEALPAEQQEDGPGRNKYAQPVEVPKLKDLLDKGEDPAVAAGIVARQQALKAGKTLAEADHAAAEATNGALDEQRAAEKAKAEKDAADKAAAEKAKAEKEAADKAAAEKAKAEPDAGDDAGGEREGEAGNTREKKSGGRTRSK